MDDTAAMIGPLTKALAERGIQDDNLNPETASPNGMLIDTPEEHVIEPNGAETEDVAIINPDGMETDMLLASDCVLTILVPCSHLRR